MRAEELAHVSHDGVALFLRRWSPDGEPVGVLQIAHGLAEHSERYGRLAQTLTDAGYIVYANDHRGHGHTAPRGELGHFADEDGWTKCVGDLVSLHRRFAADHEGLPLFFLGHSMGSFMGQAFIAKKGVQLAGAAFSGSNGPPPTIATIARGIARAERLRLGRKGVSPVLRKLMFGDFNKKFKPARTDFDWLSRDTAEVDAYIADPLCGHDYSTQLVVDLLDGLGGLLAPENLARIPRNLPIYIMSGARDPVSSNIQGLISAYRSAGFDVTEKIYPDGRHELLNEINREEVTRDFLHWLEQHRKTL